MNYSPFLVRILRELFVTIMIAVTSDSISLFKYRWLTREDKIHVTRPIVKQAKKLGIVKRESTARQPNEVLGPERFQMSPKQATTTDEPTQNGGRSSLSGQFNI